MIIRRLAVVVFSLFVFATAAFAASDPTYEALRAARPDGRSVPVTNLVLERDAFRFTFASGAFHFLAPVEGRTFGAVFAGQGSYELKPASAAEKKHLQLSTRQPALETLTDQFDELVLLFGDGTAKEIEGHAAATKGAPDARAKSIYDAYLKKQKDDFLLNVHARILQDFLNGWDERSTAFFAYVDGKQYPPAASIFDRRGIGSFAAELSFLGGEETALLVVDPDNGGLWYLSARKEDAKSGRGKPHPALADAIHYTIDTTIEKNKNLTAETTLEIRPVVENVRVLPLLIYPELKISSASYRRGDAGEWTPIPFVQEQANVSALKKLFRDEITDSEASVVFPAPLKRGEQIFLRISYGGSGVIKEGSRDEFYIGARESWYPNLSIFTDPALFDLTFRAHKSNDVISVGTLTGTRVEGDQKITTWKSDVPMRVAGFNFGKFKKVERDDADSKLKIEVYTNQLSSRDASGLADAAIADAMNTARIAKLFFGDPPFKRLGVTQQTAWFYGQSWPTLVFMPTSAFVDSTSQVLGMGEEAGSLGVAIAGRIREEFLNSVGAHEVAHQWWGHLVGWQSYRDQWLSEGFSQFTAALVVQHTMTGKEYSEFWERERKRILEKKAGSLANYEAGAITQGHRLTTRRTPAAGFAMMYSKGAYVLHMLRSMMRDAKAANPDQAFIAMMRDYVASYSMKNPSTDDFQRIVSKHMGGDMSWFFNQWVHGTEIPTLKSTLQIREIGGGKYKLSGTVSQEGVSKEFRVVVPIYVDFGKNQIAQIGSVPLTGPSTYTADIDLPLPKKPRRVVINAMNEVLSKN